MRISVWKTILCSLLASVLLTTAVSCVNKAGPEANSVPPAASTPVRTEAFTDVRGAQWIPLSQVADTLGLRALETDSSARIGYTDVMFEVQPSQRHAVSFGKPVSLPQAPIRQNGQLYMTAASVSALLQSKTAVDPLSGRLNIGPINADGGVAEKNPQIGESNRYGILGVAEHRDEMVAYAKSFLGVPYEFGAAPYEQSKAFDCSSFTRHVFKKFGQDLPRLAKDQAKEGIPVTRDNLQAGDLIFFTVPGRFETDNIPGHVGIYIGNGQFIHTWGDPGVEISPLDTGHWSSVILSMRRMR